MNSLSGLEWGILEVLSLLLVFGIGFIVTYITLPFIIKFMKRTGHVGRDIHKNAHPEVAESGGLGIVIGFSVGSLSMMLLFPSFLNEIVVFLITVVLAGMIGFLDDRIKLRSRYKMIMVIFAGSVIFLANFIGFVNIQSPTIPFLGSLRLTMIYPYVVPIIVMVFANATNMLEGYNGEGAGTCLIAVIFLLVCAIIWDSAQGVLFSVIVISVLLPFLLFNKFPAKVFPGDVGTLTMGAMLACIALFGSLEVAVFCALFIHIFNSFYVLYSVRGFIESSEIQEDKNDIILLEDDKIKASDKKDAALTLPRLILAKGPLTEPQLVKNFYLISVICGFFALIATSFNLWTLGRINLFNLITLTIVYFVPIIFLNYKFERIRGIVILMTILLFAGAIFMVIIDSLIMPNVYGCIDLKIICLPLNLVVAFAVVAPGLLLWYYITLRYFWSEIKKMDQDSSKIT
jgi:UDP-N-acetylglucosamine--dolichyl-phosphate N-acetylglucosaminephosphotransferase